MRPLGLSLASILLIAPCASEPPATDTSSPTPAGSPSPSASEVPATPSDPFAEQFLAAHDRARANARPAPETPLPAMTWSQDLAAHAQRVVESCSFEHSESDYGENLAARTDMVEPEAIVGDWVAEQANYDYRENRCAPNQVCGHYTQVVWRKSTQLGCAVNRCNRNSPFGSGEWVFWVCNYAPAGNFVGQRPY